MDCIPPRVYAVKHKDIQTRMASRSGGIFTALSDEVLRREGAVYGCVLNEHFEAMHVRAVNADERDKMRGSKYIQSNMGDTYRSVKADLIAGRWVLFSGTSCQIAGLQSFLQRKYVNLLCVDLVCYGVPSTLVWREYLSWQEKKNKGKCVKVDFRNKREYGWAAHVETLHIKKKNGKIKAIHSDIFRTLFSKRNILRPCCYQCPYKSIYHPGDITIADYWGIEKAAPGFNDDKGVSLVLVNNEIGSMVFEAIKCEVDWAECEIENSMQTPLQHPHKQPKARMRFWEDFHGRGFAYIVWRYYSRLKIQTALQKLNRFFAQRRDSRL